MKRDEIKKRIPYLIVARPRTLDVAVYDRQYKLMNDEYRSPHIRTAIYNFARRNPTKHDYGFTLSRPDQQPKWMTSEIKEESEMFFIYLDSMDDYVLDNIRLRWASIVTPYKGRYFGERLFGSL